MALLFSESFDNYTSSSDAAFLQKWDQVVGSTYVTTGGRFGGGAIHMNGGSDALSKVIPLSGVGTNELFTGFWLRLELPSTLTFRALVALQNSAGLVGLALAYNPATGRLGVYRTASGNLADTDLIGGTSPILSVGMWYWVEMRVIMANTGGLVQVRLNGNTTPFCDFSGDTNAQTIDGVVFVGYGSPAGPLNTYFLDDILIWNNQSSSPTGFIGPQRLVTSRPNAVGTYEQWTGTGDNFSLVDDVGLNDGNATIVTSSTIGQKDTYNFADLAVAPQTITAVGVVYYFRSNGTTPRRIKPLVRSGGTDFEDTVPIDIPFSPVTFTSTTRFYPLNPVTNGAWTEANFNTVEVGQILSE